MSFLCYRCDKSFPKRWRLARHLKRKNICVQKTKNCSKKLKKTQKDSKSAKKNSKKLKKTQKVLKKTQKNIVAIIVIINQSEQVI